MNWWKYALTFAAGATVGVIAYKHSEELRAICTKAVGGVLDIKDKAMEQVEIIKESAEDLVAEADSKRKSPKKA